LSSNDADAKIPHSVIDQSLDPVQEYKTKMGVINFHYMYGHYFEASGYLMMLIDEFNMWLKHDVEVLKLPNDNRFGFKIPPTLPPDFRSTCIVQGTCTTNIIRINMANARIETSGS